MNTLQTNCVGFSIVVQTTQHTPVFKTSFKDNYTLPTLSTRVWNTVAYAMTMFPVYPLSMRIENLRAAIKSTVSLLSQVIPLAFLTLSLGACDKLDADNDEAKAANAEDTTPLSSDNQHYPTRAMTWKEWVSTEAVLRARGEYKVSHGFWEPSYRSEKGFPNISKWTPEDFLPAEFFKETHRDLCELPERNREILRDTIDYRGDIYRLLALAEQGYAEAQSTLGEYCAGGWQVVELGSNPEDKEPVSESDALHWARRGAASGNAFAQYRLGICMLDRYKAKIDYDDSFFWPGEKRKPPINLDPFWLDEAYFWIQRAVEQSLLHEPLYIRRDLHFRFGKVVNTAGWINRRFIEEYKLARLWTLKAGFRRYQQRSFDYGSADRYGKVWSTKSSLTNDDPLQPQRMAQAEKELGEWLRAHPNIWQHIYDNSYIQGSVATKLCPGEPGYKEAFNFNWLAKELKQYGVELNVPSS